MSKRVELPEVEVACGVLWVPAKRGIRQPKHCELSEIAHRCNHYMELEEALEELLEVQQATKQGFEQRQKARAALAKAKGE